MSNELTRWIAPQYFSKDQKAPFDEAHRCECQHGSARHSDKFAVWGVGRIGRLCLISTCGCYAFKAEGQ